MVPPLPSAFEWPPLPPTVEDELTPLPPFADELRPSCEPSVPLFFAALPLEPDAAATAATCSLTS